MRSYTDFINEQAQRADGGANIKTKHLNINSEEPKMATGPDSLRVTDSIASKVQKSAHRVSLNSMVKKIKEEEYIYPKAVPHMTICVMVMDNGYAVVGKSAPADPENFDEQAGRTFSREDAIRQLWPLEGYALREKLHGREE